MFTCPFADILVLALEAKQPQSCHMLIDVVHICFDGQIRAASEDALEVEKTTRKWLSIMNKDCNRFCKILVRFYLLL